MERGFKAERKGRCSGEEGLARALMLRELWYREGFGVEGVLVWRELGLREFLGVGRVLVQKKLQYGEISV